MMYKGTKSVKAKTFAEHKKLDKMGYSHDKPKKGLNPKYTKGLTKKQAQDKAKNIKKSRELLKKGKKKEAGDLAKKRPTTKKNMKQSTYTTQFKKMHPNVKPLSASFAKATGIPYKIQKKIFERGEGAFISAGSRPQVGSKEQWGYARLYAFYIKAKKGKLDFDKDLLKLVKLK